MEQWKEKKAITDQNHNGLFSVLFLENHRKFFEAAQLVMGFCADLSSFSDMSPLLE